jgi:hypothetical protein
MLKSTLPLFIVPVLQSISSPGDFYRKDNELVLSIDYSIDNIVFPSSKLLFVKINSSIFEVININDNAISFENKLNNRYLNEFEQKFSRQFISYLLDDDFEYGMESKAHILVLEQMRINAVVTKNWLNKIYVDNFENAEILIGILRVIARFERDEIYPIGDTIAIASLSHKDEIVQETAIRTFESWGGFNSIKILENVTVSSKWVQSYLYEVISDLKTEYVN